MKKHVLRGGCVLLLMSLILSAADLGGTYAGEWKNKAGKSGRYQLTFTANGAQWQGVVVAVLDGEEVTAPMKSLKIQGDSFEASYDFAVKGTKLGSKIEGKRSGDNLSGKFETLYEGKTVDSGTWNAALKK
jgi:hypothetical protein